MLFLSEVSNDSYNSNRVFFLLFEKKTFTNSQKLKNTFRNILATLLFFLFSQSVSSQALIDKITRVFEHELHNKNRDSTHYVTQLVLAPIIAYEPSTSLGMGVGAKILFKPKGAGAETRTSNIPVSALYTLKNQFFLSSDYTVFTPQEKWLLKGKFNYSKFPVAYFGQGRRSLLADEREVAFKRILIEPLVLKKIGSSNLFLGGGFRMNHSFGAKLEKHEEKTLKNNLLLDSLESTSVGFEFAATLDSRDNVLNATKGTFLEFTHGAYGTFLGGTNKFMLTKADFRKYFRTNPDKLNVIALQLYTRLSWNDTPLLELSTLGGAELLRGFQEGRFRDAFTYFTQVEYRWQTFRRIGFVFFGGAGDVMAKEENFEFGQLKYSLGTGIRIKLVEKENLNIRFDYAFGFGEERENNFYLGIAEAF